MLAILCTFLIETIYQSWIMGLGIILAAVAGFIVAVEDALVSDSIETRNYGLLVVLVACFTVVTMSILVLQYTL